MKASEDGVLVKAGPMTIKLLFICYNDNVPFISVILESSWSTDGVLGHCPPATEFDLQTVVLSWIQHPFFYGHEQGWMDVLTGIG